MRLPLKKPRTFQGAVFYCRCELPWFFVARTARSWNANAFRLDKRLI
jgi:hypothetical protein